MPNRALIFCFTSLGILFGILLGVVLTKWGDMHPHFWDIKFVQIIQIVITFFIAVVFTYILNIVVNKTVRKAEVIFDLIDRLQKEVMGVFLKGDDYIRHPDKMKIRPILSSLKNASILVRFIEDLKNDPLGKKIVNHDRIKEDFLGFKRTLTGSPFGEQTPHYDLETGIRFEVLYKQLYRNLHEAKLRIYS